MSQLHEGGTRHENDSGVRTGCGKNASAPQVPPHQRQDSAQGRGWLLLASRLPMRRTPIGSQRSAKEGHEAVAPEEQRGRALNGAIRPLALGRDPSLGAALLEGGFQTPALHAIAHQLFGSLRLVGGKPGVGRSFSCWVAREHAANRQGRRAKALPPRGAATQLQGPLPFALRPSPYQSRVRCSQTVWGSGTIGSRAGSRGPTTRGRPRTWGSRTWGSRTAVGSWITVSRRKGASSVIC